jgi:methylated-DNA-[protein]-cysteine S-methyltransferase
MSQATTRLTMTTPRAHYDAVVTAPFGAVGIETADGQVVALQFLPPQPASVATSALGADAAAQVERYFTDPDFCFDLPLRIKGTPFQRRVWDAIATIPRGRTRRYGELAAELGAPARTVGQACGDNRLPLIIPCHRVIGAASLGGFAHARSGFALSVKRWLLEHEHALVGTLL